MAQQTSIELRGHEQLLAGLARLASATADLTPVLDEIGAHLERAVALRFETKTDPAGSPWAPWAESTRRKYAREDGSARRGTLLERTGLMLSTLTHNVSGSSVEVGFGVPYAIWHEAGTARMPRRGMLLASVSGDGSSGELAADDQQAILDLIDDHLRQALP